MKKLSFLFFISFQLIFSQCYKKISCGSSHVILINSQDYIFGFGSAQTGQLGNQSENNVLNPIQFDINNHWKDIYASSLRSFFIKQDGTLWGTGNNSFGCLGINSNSGSTNVITQIGNASNWLKIVGSPTHTVGLREDGTLWGWGQNNDYELGQGVGNNYLSQLTPIQIGTDNHWVDVGVTDSGTFALKNDGTFWGCGFNSNVILGFLGNYVYTLSQGPSNNWSKIKAGSFFILAQKTDGTLWSWGSGTFGQVGNGQFSGSLTPFQITTDTWKDFAAGSLRSYGIKTDGTLWAWGRNQEGQLGDGTFENRNLPTQIGTDNDWDRIYAAGATTTVGVKNDGSVWVWGNNDFGQFGNGTLNQGSNVPLQNTALCTLGVDGMENFNGKIAFYPNPAQNEINFAYENLPNASVQIIDMNGRVLHQINTIGLSGLVTLVVNQWEKGIYLCKILTENNQTAVKKIIID
ncbi:T9SS type A sorting domain-containing protein [Flavobacterium sp.]|uniref:T9SS type A sorting domain-containing protein n=1 Tax=Flavobacterium sp. TaxID=239 RepID=UPI0039E40FD7